VITIGRPPNIYCIGRSYAKHAKELGNPVPKDPVVFLKSTSSLRGLSWDGSYRDELLQGMHYEAEIVLQVGKRPGSTLPGICAAGLGLDLTERLKQVELKNAGLPWTLAKSFPGAAVVSGFTPLSDLPPWQSWSFEFELEGELVQTGATSQMLFELPFLAQYLEEKFGLLEGDLIFTGTPSGVGACRPGQAFVLSGFGKLNFSGIL